jgi:hypothetical protein
VASGAGVVGAASGSAGAAAAVAAGPWASPPPPLSPPAAPAAPFSVKITVIGGIVFSGGGVVRHTWKSAAITAACSNSEAAIAPRRSGRSGAGSGRAANELMVTVETLASCIGFGSGKH